MNWHTKSILRTLKAESNTAKPNGAGKPAPHSPPKPRRIDRNSKMLCAVCLNKIMGFIFPIVMLALAVLAVYIIVFKILGCDPKDINW